MELKITRAELKDIPTIQQLANVAFRHTYAKILQPQQMDYMLDMMYGTDSLIPQVTAPGKEFYLAEYQGTLCGYASFEFEKMLNNETPQYHLQKLYLEPQFHGNGLGKELFDFIVSRMKELSPNGFRLELNVNRYNKTVTFYEHLGLYRSREGDFPIGNGYYMNDYIYALDYKG